MENKGIFSGNFVKFSPSFCQYMCNLDGGEVPLWQYVHTLESNNDIDSLLDVLRYGDWLSRVRAMSSLFEIAKNNKMFWYYLSVFAYMDHDNYLDMCLSAKISIPEFGAISALSNSANATLTDIHKSLSADVIINSDFVQPDFVAPTIRVSDELFFELNTPNKNHNEMRNKYKLPKIKLPDS